MRVKLWGTRGSIPTPERNRLKYGGNTSCLSVTLDECPERVIILDAGTGIRELGLDLVRKPGPLKVDMLLSHLHWDHIQGIPFFRPLFSEKTACAFIGCGTGSANIEQGLRRAISPPFSPVTFDLFKADVRFEDAGEARFEIGPVAVNVIPVHHPGGAVAFRMTHHGRSLVYMTDSEIPCAQESEMYRKLRDFSREADVLIHDAQHTPDEYTAKRGWGHSSCRDAVRYAMECRVGRLVLFHHDPAHDDATVDSMVACCRQMLVAEGSPMECGGGYEGLELEV